jgi:hypothetical protein
MKKGLELKTQAREIAADIERHHHDLVRERLERLRAALKQL